MVQQPKWYYYFVKQEDPTKRYLLTDLNIPVNSLIICQEPKKGERRYALFNSYLEFHNYIFENIEVEEFTFYEIILGNRPQKIYLDFDIKPSPTESIQDLIIKAHISVNTTINKIKEMLPQIKDENVIVCNSNANYKLSYHIIIDRHCFQTSKENKEFYKNLTANLEIPYLPDHNLYSSMQNFRIYGSHKPGELHMRTKRLDLDLNRWKNPDPENEITSYIQTYLATLVTNTSYCKYLPTPEQTEDMSSNYSNTSLLSEEEIEKATEIFRKYHGEPFPYTQSNALGNNIFYKRLFPSHCEFCNKTHSRQIPYLSITTINKDVYLSCKNSKEKGKLIGSLKYANRKLIKKPPSQPKVKPLIPEFRNCQKGDRFSLKNMRVKLTYPYHIDEIYFKEKVEEKINNFIKEKVKLTHYQLHKTNISTHIALEFNKPVVTTKTKCFTFDEEKENPKIEGVNSKEDYDWLCKNLDKMEDEVEAKAQEEGLAPSSNMC